MFDYSRNVSVYSILHLDLNSIACDRFAVVSDLCMHSTKHRHSKTSDSMSVPVANPGHFKTTYRQINNSNSTNRREYLGKYCS